MTDLDEIEKMLADRTPEAPEVSHRLVLGTHLDGWKVVSFLGAGRSAEVYRVINLRMGGEAALKLLIDSSFGLRERFDLERDVLRTLPIAGLPRFFGDGEVEGMPFYVMEYLQPLNLPLATTEILPFMSALAASVEALHSAGYIHRDIKPANILRRRSGEPVLIDLGLVKSLTESRAVLSDGLSCIDGKRVGVGTPDFAAPEQLIKGESTIRSDVFALGKMLKECGGKTLGSHVRHVMHRATAEDPADRYPTAAAFAAALQRAGNFRRRLFLTLAGSVLALSFGALAFLALHKQTPEPTPPPVVAPPPPVVAPVAPESPQKLSRLQEPGESDADYLARLLLLAEKGDVVALNDAAEAYYYGRGTATNLAESVRLYRRAAEKGHVGAQVTLGNCLLHGRGCEKNEAEATHWILRAAKAGNRGAMVDLAFCFRNGIGVDHDYREAFQWAMKAAQNGHPEAEVFVGECYREGFGVAKDLRLADIWLRRAAEHGNKRAQELYANP